MTIRLKSSFEALYAALEIPHIARRTVVALLVMHTGLLAYSGYVHSPTLNEPGHLVAGLSHWKFGRYDVYNVNPPLVRMVAALPVMAIGYDEDWSSFITAPYARPEMRMGEDFVAANAGRTFFLFTVARWACIPFSWVGAAVCYLWARDLCSRPAGVMACAIWCFEPNILAHASLITADASATALGLAACYTFWRWLKQPTWTQAALTGVVLGLAELAKTTLILFYPLWPLMWLVYRWTDRCQMRATDWFREAGMLAVRMLIGLYVLNLGYGFEDSFQRLKEFHFVSNLFAGRETRAEGQEPDIPQSANRFANSWLGNLPVPFPKHYLQGIDIQQRDFEHYGRRSYLCGVWSDQGWWYYYLYAAAIKVPLGLWAIGVFALIATLRHRTLDERWGEGQNRDYFILLFPAIVIFLVVSSKIGFSEHMRYVLPAFPFFYVAIATGTTRLLTVPEGMLDSPVTGPLRRLAYMPLLSSIIVVSLGLWMIASSLWIYPHSLSYFNESIGGPLNGTKHLISSNVDWGQDLLYWQQKMLDEDGNHSSGRIQVAHFGYYNVSDLKVDASLAPCECPGRSDPREWPIGDYAISVNFLAGYSSLVLHRGQDLQSIARPSFRYFSEKVPTARLCYSGKLYHL